MDDSFVMFLTLGNPFLLSILHVCLFIFFSPFTLHIWHAGTVPGALSHFFFCNSESNNHLYGNSLKMLCCIQGREDNERKQEEQRLFFSFSAVFQPSLIQLYCKSITHKHLRIPNSHQKWNWLNVISQSNLHINKKCIWILKKVCVCCQSWLFQICPACPRRKGKHCCLSCMPLRIYRINSVPWNASCGLKWTF